MVNPSLARAASSRFHSRSVIRPILCGSGLGRLDMNSRANRLYLDSIQSLAETVWTFMGLVGIG